MQANGNATVLCAETCGFASRYEAAHNAVAAAATKIADSTGGLVVKRVGTKVLMLFATPDAAASAASKMHAMIEALPPIAGSKLGVHVGFHAGPPPQPDKGLSDDTVNLALRLLEQAQDGQTLTSAETAVRLNPAFRNFSRCRHPMGVESGQTWLFELESWHQKGLRPPGWSAMAVLRLTCREQLVVCSREKDWVVIGRDDSCDLLVDSAAASRRHCTIRHAHGHFVLRDHSSYGTYVTAGDGIELKLANDELALADQGTISLAAPHGRTSAVVGFCFALVT